MNKIYSEVVVVSPQEAQEILATRNTVNRPINKRQVERFAASMQAGEWRINGECLIFAPDGRLLDGQNRLSAVVKAGTSVAFCVWFNIPEDAVVSMNTGRVRSAAHVLHFMGYQNARIMAPIARLGYIYDCLDRHMNIAKCAHAVNTDLVVRHAKFLDPAIIDSTNLAANCHHWLKPSVVGFCHLIFARKNKTMADKFVEQLKSNEKSTIARSIKTLRKNLIAGYTHGRKGLPMRQQLAMYILAWNAFISDEQKFELDWNAKNDVFPEVK